MSTIIRPTQRDLEIYAKHGSVSFHLSEHTQAGRIAGGRIKLRGLAVIAFPTHYWAKPRMHHDPENLPKITVACKTRKHRNIQIPGKISKCGGEFQRPDIFDGQEVDLGFAMQYSDRRWKIRLTPYIYSAEA